MDDAVREQKIRSLKIRILQVEKEIAAKQHGSKLNAFLSVGHASQIAKASERETKRLEDRLEVLRKQLGELDPTAATPAKEAEKPARPKAGATVKTKKTETAKKEETKKKSAATKPVKNSSKKTK